MKMEVEELERGDVVRLDGVGEVRLSEVRESEELELVTLRWLGEQSRTLARGSLVEQVRSVGDARSWERAASCRRCQTGSRQERRGARLEAIFGPDGLLLRCTHHGVVVLVTPGFLNGVMRGDPPACDVCGEPGCGGRHGSN